MRSDEKRVVFHLDWDDEKPVEMALYNITNILSLGELEPANIHVVANGPAVKLFIAHRVYSYFHKVEELNKLGVTFSLCNLALKNYSVASEALLPLCRVVDAGVIELIALQEQGYSYIKP